MAGKIKEEILQELDMYTYETLSVTTKSISINVYLPLFLDEG